MNEEPKGMTLKEARAMQRRYQRKGYRTWLTSHIFSGQEHLGLQYWVAALSEDEWREHTLHRPHERIGGIRQIVI